MFNDKLENKSENIIGEKSKLIGTFTGKESLRIDGIIEGDIIIDDDIIINPTGLCLGNISCYNAYINGTVKGNLICKNTLTLLDSGKIVGDITANKLVVHNGGKFSGESYMFIDDTLEPPIIIE